MIKSEIEESLHKVSKGSSWITKTRLKRWFGSGTEKLNKFVDGMDYRISGNRIEFFIPDVAEKVMSERMKNYE